MMHFLLIFFLFSPVLANPWAHLKTGDQAAQEFLNKVGETKTRAGPHPFHHGQKSREANLKSDDLKGESKRRSDPASQMVRESSDSRPQVKIDAQHDPLIKRAHKILEDPLKAIGGEGTQLIETVQGGTNEILNCEEAGEDALETCTSELKVKVIKTKIQKYWEGQFHFWKERKARRHGIYLACPALRSSTFNVRRCKSGDITAAYKACLQELGNRLSRGCTNLPSLSFNLSQMTSVQIKGQQIIRKKRSRTIAKQKFFTNCTIDSNNHGTKYECHPYIKINYEEDSYQVLPDEWTSNCDRLEARSDLGLCSYVSKVCTQGRQTRIIEGIPITRDCWQYTLTYGCSYPSKNDCGPLRARGCAQINSSCKQMVGNNCVVYSQTYQCTNPPQTTHTIKGGHTPFCLDGNCRDQSWENNKEMMSSLAQLAILKEMQGQFGKGGFFKGETNKCSKQPLSFKDCCGSGKGWGNDLGLSSCSSKEKLLSQKRKKGLCHYVGTYCSKKILGQCIKKKSTYCCFGSKLLKTFHEQGRRQIGLGWGEPKEPLCRGFTIEEIQRIDFSKLDLREVFEDLMKNFKPGKMQGISKKVGDRLETIKKGLVPKATQQPRQRKEA